MARTKAVDPVTKYAIRVRDGQEIVSRLVRLACLRHLNDLAHAEAKGLVWKPQEAIDAIDFFADVLYLPEETDRDDDDDEDAITATGGGTPFVLSPFQAFIVGSLFGWFMWRVKKSTGSRQLRQRFRIAYFEGAKGCGKTPMGAGILLYMLVRHGVKGAQLFCAAVTKDQAKLAFADCEKMVAASPPLRELVDQKVNNLAVLSTGSFIRPISSEKRGLDGKRVQGAVIDELHEHPSAMVVAKVRAGIKGRPNALIFIPTNSGFDRESVCWEYHEYSRQVLEGTLVNETWFAFVCHLDPCDKCFSEGKRQPSDDCPDCDDWTTEGPHWLKANPNLGVSLTWEYLREQVREAISLPSQRNLIRRLNFCQWTDQATVWIPREKWDQCRGDITPTSMHGRECYIGIDLSEKIDLSAVVLVFPRPMAGKPVETADGKTIDHAIDVLPYFWMPAATIQRRSREDAVPYQDWHKAGYITATNGTMIDHDVIVAFVVSLKSRYLIRGIGYDQSGAASVVTQLQRHFSEDMVIDVPQGFVALSSPSKTLEALVISGNLSHDGNPVMAMCISNMAIDEDKKWAKIRPVKISQRKRIDGGVALIDALHVIEKHEPAPDPSFQMLILGANR